MLSFFDKKNTHQELLKKDAQLTVELADLDHKISLISKNDPDYATRRILNQQKAWMLGKNVVLTIDNPNKNETNKKFIKVNLCKVVYLTSLVLKADISKSHIFFLFFKE
mgnify:CR=1 FL=1